MLPSCALDQKPEILIHKLFVDLGYFWLNCCVRQLFFDGLRFKSLENSSSSPYLSTKNMKSYFRTKQLAAAFVAPLLLTSASQAALVIAGITDGDLTGGNPKSIILQAAAPVADLSVWSIGSANNGGGTDGEEFTLPAGSLDTGGAIVIVANSASLNFFQDNFVQNFTLVQTNVASVNGDDAIELFNNGSIFDVYGDPDTIGDGETWDYTNGYAFRIGLAVGPFDQENYSSNAFAWDNATEQQHIDPFVAAGFTAIPEPGSVLLFGLAGLGFLRRRR